MNVTIFTPEARSLSREMRYFSENLLKGSVLRVVCSPKVTPEMVTTPAILIGKYAWPPSGRPTKINGHRVCRVQPVPEDPPPLTEEYDRMLDDWTRQSFIAKAYLNGETMCPPVEETPVDANTFISALKCTTTGYPISIDIETTSLSPVDGNVVCLAAWWPELEEHPMVCYGTRDCEKVISYLTSTDKPLLGCNTKFEMSWFLKISGKTGNFVGDVQVDDCLLRESSHHGLEHLAGRVSAYGYDLEMENILNPVSEDKPNRKVEVKLRHHEAPQDALTKYNALDAMVTGQVYEVLSKKLLEEPANQKTVRGWLNRGQRCLARMYDAGMQVNVKLLQDYAVATQKSIVEDTEVIRNEATKHGMAKFNIRSGQQKSVLLYDKMGLPMIRKTDSGKWGSCDEDVLNKLDEVSPGNPVIAALLRVNSNTALYDGFLARCMDHKDSTGRIRSDLSLTKLVTGQISSTNPPMQNVSKSPIRNVFTSRWGKDGVMMEIDYSQLHLRIMGNLSGCPGFISAYENGVDLHSRTAAATIANVSEDVFLKKIKNMDPVACKQRDMGKRVNFAIIFEIGPASLEKQIHLPYEKCKRVIDRFFEKYPEVKEQINRQHKYAIEHGYVISPTGRVRHLPFSTSLDRSTQSRQLRQASDFLISNSGRYTTIYGMVMLDEEMERRNMKSRLVLQVHDSVLLDVHKSEIDGVITLVRTCCIDKLMDMFDWMRPIPFEMDGFYNSAWVKDESAKKFNLTWGGRYDV